MIKGNKTLIFSIVVAGLLLCTPEHVFCANDYGASEIYAQIDGIKSFLFGPITKFAALFGLGWGIIQSITTSSPKPLLFWIAVALIISGASALLDNLFPSKGNPKATSMNSYSEEFYETEQALFYA